MRGIASSAVDFCRDFRGPSWRRLAEDFRAVLGAITTSRCTYSTFLRPFRDEVTSLRRERLPPGAAYLRKRGRRAEDSGMLLLGAITTSRRIYSTFLRLFRDEVTALRRERPANRMRAGIGRSRLVEPNLNIEIATHKAAW